MSTIEQPDFTYESDREILISEIIEAQRKMESVRLGLEETIRKGGDVKELKQRLDGCRNEIEMLEEALNRLREISGPRSKSKEAMSIN